MSTVETSNRSAVSLIVAGVITMLGAFTHLILIMIWGECKFLYLMTHGGVGGTPRSNLDPLYWNVVVIELLVAVVLLVVGILKTIRRETHEKQ